MTLQFGMGVLNDNSNDARFFKKSFGFNLSEIIESEDQNGVKFRLPFTYWNRAERITIGDYSSLVAGEDASYIEDNSVRAKIIKSAFDGNDPELFRNYFIGNPVGVATEKEYMEGKVCSSLVHPTGMDWFFTGLSTQNDKGEKINPAPVHFRVFSGFNKVKLNALMVRTGRFPNAREAKIASYLIEGSFHTYPGVLVPNGLFDSGTQSKFKNSPRL